MTASSEKTSLIDDDTPENIDILNELLSEYNRKVAVNRQMAIKVAEKTEPDLILLDDMTPVIDGFDAAKKLKQIPETANIPIVFITAKTDISNFVKRFDIGADETV